MIHAHPRPSMQSLPEDPQNMPPPVCQSSMVRHSKPSKRRKCNDSTSNYSSEIPTLNSTDSSSIIPNSQGGSMDISDMNVVRGTRQRKKRNQ